SQAPCGAQLRGYAPARVLFPAPAAGYNRANPSSTDRAEGPFSDGSGAMDPDDVNRPLNRISTLWTVVCQAHDGSAAEASSAQQLLLRRYAGAVHRYLLGPLRDPDAAGELSREFALRFIRGDFRGAAPARGRFRDFVKGVLSPLIADPHRRLRARPQPLPDDLAPA